MTDKTLQYSHSLSALYFIFFEGQDEEEVDDSP